MKWETQFVSHSESIRITLKPNNFLIPSIRSRFHGRNITNYQWGIKLAQRQSVLFFSLFFQLTPAAACSRPLPPAANDTVSITTTLGYYLINYPIKQKSLLINQQRTLHLTEGRHTHIYIHVSMHATTGANTHLSEV